MYALGEEYVSVTLSHTTYYIILAINKSKSKGFFASSWSKVSGQNLAILKTNFVQKALRNWTKTVLE
jgi:hypothetical protein